MDGDVTWAWSVRLNGAAGAAWAILLADGPCAGAAGYPTPVASTGIVSAEYVTCVASMAGALTIVIRPFAWFPGLAGPVESTQANTRNASTLAIGNADLVRLIP